jgi:hypothetical protein
VHRRADAYGRQTIGVYIDNHITRLDSLGHAELARGFGEWRERLLC